MKKRGGGLVYSSEHGEVCPACRKPVTRCECRGKGPAAASKPGVVYVRRETKGRRGKGVTLIEGVRLAPAELAGLTRELKQKCGTGGTIKDGVIEIQGDHRETLVDELVGRGWKARRAGG